MAAVIRRATLRDLDAILAVYAAARLAMRRMGNPHQWQDSYPPPSLVQADIQQGCCYVLAEGTDVFAVFAFLPGEDATYRVIEQGAWLDDGPYAAVHRVASDGRQHGVLRRCLAFCEARAASIRVDTHADNAVMRHLLSSCGYRQCGIIHIADGSPRIAFQKCVGKAPLGEENVGEIDP